MDTYHTVKKEKRKRRERKTNLIVTLVLLAVIAVCAFTVFNKAVLNKTDVTIFGTGVACVVSGSMEPVISVNDAVIYHRERPESIKKGDIVVYKDNGSLVTHRVVKATSNGFVTKGDANNVADQPIYKDSLVGKVIKIMPKVGVISQWLNTPLGIIVIIIVLFCLWIFRGNYHEHRK